MSEGGVTAVEEALRIHPTWINGGGDIPGPGGAVIAAMLAVASGLCRHVLCFRTVWESTFAALGLRDGGGGRVGGFDGVAGAVRRDVGVELDRDERQPVPPPLRRDPRAARLHRAQRPGQRRSESRRDLPRSDDDGRLHVRPADHHAVRPVRLRRAMRRIDRGRSCPMRRSPPIFRSRRSVSTRSGTQITRAHLVGPGARSRTSRKSSASRRTCGSRIEPAPGRRRCRARLRRVHLQRHLMDRSAGFLRASERQRTGSTAAGASPSTATCR